MTHRASCLCLPPLIGVAILLAACQGPGLPPAPPPDLVSDDPATLSNPTGATLPDATATGTIVGPLELSTLQVTGGIRAMYPEFSPDTLHYALTCTNSTTLDVTAQALRTTAQLTLLRADTAQNVVAGRQTIR